MTRVAEGQAPRGPLEPARRDGDHRGDRWLDATQGGRKNARGRTEEVVKEITDIVDGPISAEVISLDKEGMLKEARELVKIHPNIVIKIPMTKEGLKAVKVLTDEGIKTNVTLIFSANQALLAARAGATYVSPFVGRLDDIGNEGIYIIEDIVQVFNMHNINTEIIAASIRHPIHVLDAAKAGAHISTIPYKVFIQMLAHPLTDSGIAQFLKDWDSLQTK